MLGSRITALTFEVDFFIPTYTLAKVVTDLPAMFAAEHAKGIEYARDLRATGYNLIAFPLAARVFYPFLLSPEIAALAMSGSSALVAINALLLKRTRLGAGPLDVPKQSYDQPAARRT